MGLLTGIESAALQTNNNISSTIHVIYVKIIAWLTCAGDDAGAGEWPAGLGEGMIGDGDG
jgi:hypothetical protein